ncbi:hypothetical protein DFH08DRAFT_312702 [Mycena albidolilacea]|uniref:MAPEG family protein n=1 Tax=Mycena albidolilacea TaxID=1033008 RepID=A0AAD6ZMS1_9AGAR|nr:hypothetical protein DFH08DRAFT_312702 [Mycena albidolilacea]
MSASGKSPMDWSRESPIPFPFVVLSCYLSGIPLIRILSSPTGLGGRFLTPLLSSALHSVSDGASSVENNPQKAVALLTVFYVFVVYILSAIMSALAQLLGNKTGYKNKEPRLNKRTVAGGIPHRMVATHEALYDIFPAYAVAAALVASTFTGPSASMVTAINALVLHVFLKLFVFAPVYLLGIDPVRTYSHMCAVAAVLVAIWSVVVS